MPQTQKNLKLENKTANLAKLAYLMWFILLLLLFCIFYFSIKPSKIILSGSFVDNAGKPLSDKKYDFRVLAVDQNDSNRKVLTVWDYKDVDTTNGAFKITVNPKLLALPLNSYLEVCYLPKSNYFQENISASISTCDAFQNDTTNNFMYVACSRKLVQQGLKFNLQNIFGISSNNLSFPSSNLGCTSILDNNNIATSGNLDLINNFPFANFLSTEQKQEILDQRTEFVQNIVQSYLQNYSTTNSNNSSTSQSDNDKQKLNLSGTQLSIENGNSIDLASLLSSFSTIDNDKQTLKINGNAITISNGNSITLPAVPGQVPQVLTYNNGTLNLSNGGGSVTIPTDSQQLSISGSTISLTNGGSITLPAPATDLYVTNATLSNSTASGSTTRTLTLTRSGGLPDLTITIPDNDTLFTSGPGLTLTSNVFAIKPCSSDEVLKYDSTNSDWKCSIDNDTTYTAGDGIVLNSNTFSLKVCNASELLVYNGSNWVCIPDSKYTYTAGTGININSSNQVSNTGTLSVTSSGVIGVTSGQNPVVSLNPCSDGQFLYYNSNAWACLDFSTLDKYHDAISTTDSGSGVITHAISLTGPNGTPSLSTNIVDADSQHLTYDSTTRTLAISGTNGNSTVNSVTLPADKYLSSATIGASSVTSGSTSRDLTLTMSDGTTYTITIPDNDTLYSAGDGISLSGTTFKINSPTCTTNQRLSWSGTAFTCENTKFTITDGTNTETVNPNSTITYSAVGPLKAQISATNTVTYSILPCSNNEVLRYNTTSSSWVCDNVSLNAGNTNGVTVSGSGTSASPFIVDLRTDCTNNQVLQFNTTNSKWECKDNPDLYHTAITNTNTQPTTASGTITNKLDITSSNGAPLLTTTLTDYDNQILSYNSSTRVVSLSGPNGVGIISNVTLPDDIHLSSATISTSAVTSGSTTRTLTLTLTDGTTFPIVIPDNDTLYSTGVGLKTSGNQFYVDAPTCTTNQRLSWNGSAFACVNYTAGTGINIIGDTISNTGLLSLVSEDGIVLVNNTDSQNPRVSLKNCSEGEVYKFTSGAWKCVTEYNYNFSITDGGTTEQIDNGNVITYKADRGLEVEVSSTDTVTYRLPKCDVGYIMQYDGSVWTCAKDNLQYYDESTIVPNVQPVAAGDHSVAVGDGAKTTSQYSVILGANSYEKGDAYNAILGGVNVIEGNYGVITGYGNGILNGGESNSISGFKNAIESSNVSNILGQNSVMKDSKYSTLIGQSNSLENSDGVSILGYENKTLNSELTSVVGENNYVEKSTNGAVVGYNNHLYDIQSYIFGANITNSIPGSVQIGTDDSQKVTIYQNGDLEFHGALMPAGDSGSTGQVLISQGAGIEPIWANVGSLLTAGSGVSITGSTISVNAPTIKCAANERITWDPASGGQFTCVKTNFAITDGTNSQTIDPLDTISYKVGSTGALKVLVSSTDSVTYDLKACSLNGQVLKYNATTSTWDCATDSDLYHTAITNTNTQPTTASGTITNKLDITSSNGAPLLTTTLTDYDNQVLSYNTSTRVVSLSGPNGVGTNSNFTLPADLYVTGASMNSTATGSGSIVRTLTLTRSGGLPDIVISLPDNDTLYTAGSGLNLVANQFSINAPTCVTGQVLTWNGTAFSCVANNDWALTGNSGTNPANNFVGTTGSQDLAFRTNNVEKMRIFSLANPSIGIGVNSTSGVNGGASSYSGPTIFMGTAANISGPTGIDIVIDNDNNNVTGNGVQFRVRANADSNASGAVDLLVVDDATGNVGIGVSNPMERLDVAGNVQFAQALMPNGNAGTSGQILISQGSSVAPTWASTIGFNNLPSTGCLNGQVLKYNGTAWSCQTDAGLTSEVDGIIGNEVLNITIGTSGTTTTGGSTAFIRSGSVASGYGLDLKACANQQILKYNTTGSTWDCAADNNSGGTITSLTAGNGLNGGTITSTGTISINAPTCSGTQKLTWDGAAFACANDVDTTYTAGTGITLTGRVFSIGTGAINSTMIQDGTITQADLSSMGCTNGQVLVYNGISWTCTNDNDNVVGNEITNATIAVNTTNTRTDGIGLIRSGAGTTASPYTLDIKSCANGQILKYYTTAPAGGGYVGWNCVAELPQVLVVATKTSNVNLTGTQVALNYDSASLNVGTAYNTATGVFTAPATGYYQIDASMMYGYTNGTGVQIPALNLRKVSGTVSVLESANGVVNDCCIRTGIAQSVNVSTTVQLNVGEQIDLTHYLKATISGSNTVSSTNTTGSNRLTITRLQ